MIMQYVWTPEEKLKLEGEGWKCYPNPTMIFGYPKFQHNTYWVAVKDE